MTLDFLIIGAQKAGTTSLVRLLGQCTESVFIPRRELHFWNHAKNFSDPRLLEEYLDNFKGAQEGQIVGEKSPSYLSKAGTAERISSHFPDVKIIAILRNPIDRAISAYQHGLRIGALPAERSLDDAVRNCQKYAGVPFGDIVSNGFYTKQLRPYFELFPKESILIMNFDDLTCADRGGLYELGDFLALGQEYREFVDRREIPHANRARRSRSQRLTNLIYGSRFLSYSKKGKLTKKLLVETEKIEVPEAVKANLHDIYSEEADLLLQLTGRPFNWN